MMSDRAISNLKAQLETVQDIAMQLGIECNDRQKKLDTIISALKKLRNMDTWQNVKQINDFIDETLKGVE